MRVLALDIGATKFAAGEMGTDGRVHRVRTAAVPVAGVWAVCRDLLRVVAGTDSVDAIGIAAAGPVDVGTGSIAPLNIPEWRAGFAVVAAVRELFPGVPVRFEGDGICLALAEHRIGALRGLRNGLAVTVSSGIGGGLVVDGRVARGRTGNAGHIGHIVVPGAADVCGCGGVGCVEAVASGLSAVRWARARGWPGESGAVLAAAARSGDPIATAALERAGTALGQAISSAAALLDVDCVVIGGGFSESGAPLWNPLRAAIAAHARLRFTRGLRVLPSRITHGATLIGAGLLGIAPDATGDPGG